MISGHSFLPIDSDYGVIENGKRAIVISNENKRIYFKQIFWENSRFEKDRYGTISGKLVKDSASQIVEKIFIRYLL